MAPNYAYALALLLVVTIGMAVPARAADAGPAAMLQQAALTATAVTRETKFIHRMLRPEKPGSRTFILMHGSGGDESTLMALAAKIAPDATLVGIRGRIVQDGVKRWYKRVSPVEFDQEDVRQEADAFASFLQAVAGEERIDLSNAVFLGYSNGANLIAALSQLHPGLVRNAVLLRSMPVLAEPARPDLSNTRFLTIAGDKDGLYFPFASKLEALLRNCGASVDARVIGAGHGIGDEDARIIAEWLGAPRQ